MPATNKKSTGTTKASTTSIASTKLKEENDTLRQELEEMRKQMNIVLAQLAESNAKKDEPKQEEYTEDRLIEVINLTSATLVLSTNGKADGRQYEFNGQFDVKQIPESDLRLIVQAMPNTTERGRYYINDPEFVKKNRLSYIYSSLISADEFRGLFNKNYHDFMATYHNAPQGQKNIIETMVTDRKLNGEFVDANILLELGKITGKDYMSIEPLEEKEG